MQREGTYREYTVNGTNVPWAKGEKGRRKRGWCYDVIELPRNVSQTLESACYGGPKERIRYTRVMVGLACHHEHCLLGTYSRGASSWTDRATSFLPVKSLWRWPCRLHCCWYEYMNEWQASFYFCQGVYQNQCFKFFRPFPNHRGVSPGSAFYRTKCITCTTESDKT